MWNVHWGANSSTVTRLEPLTGHSTGSCWLLEVASLIFRSECFLHLEQCPCLFYLSQGLCEGAVPTQKVFCRKSWRVGSGRANNKERGMSRRRKRQIRSFVTSWFENRSWLSVSGVVFFIFFICFVLCWGDTSWPVSRIISGIYGSRWRSTNCPLFLSIMTGAHSQFFLGGGGGGADPEAMFDFKYHVIKISF